MTRRLWLASLVVMVVVGRAAAEEPRRLDPVVVTATTVATPAEQLGATVTVIDGDEFTTKHYPSVDEALRKVPGMEVLRQGSFGKTAGISIRGTNPNQVQVLVDGVRVKSPTLGQVDLSDLSPDLIDRVEIIRGPQATLYGADAIGGVVNIITRKGAGPFKASVQAEAGNYDMLTSGGSMSGTYRLLDYALAASYFESNGQFQNDSSDRTGLSGQVGLKLPYDSSVSFITRYTHADANYAGEATILRSTPVMVARRARAAGRRMFLLLPGSTPPPLPMDALAEVARRRGLDLYDWFVDPAHAAEAVLFEVVRVPEG